MIGVLYNGPVQFQGSGHESAALAEREYTTQHEANAISREEHRMKELSLLRGGKRTPKRSQTHHNYQLPSTPTIAIHTVRQQPQAVAEENPYSSSCTTRVQLTPGPAFVVVEPKQSEEQRTPRRPPLPPPRRSYSVMDSEAQVVPHHHRLSSRMVLLDLPTDLHYAIFDFLDPIDSTCFGLTNHHFYAIHRRLHGTVPLSTRRDGPNELEWAWHQAGALIRPPSPTDSAIGQFSANAATSTTSLTGSGGLSQLRVRGQAYCRKCGVTRCELHKHIKEWMPEGAEYCSVKRKFGPAAVEGARPYCYMSKPGDPTRCGRHRVLGTPVVLQ